MKRRFKILPFVGLTILLLLVIYGVFAGAEVSSEKALDPRGFWAFNRFLEETGFQVIGPQYHFTPSEEKQLYIILEGSDFKIDQAQELIEWTELNPHNYVLISGLPNDDEFQNYYRLEAKSTLGIPQLVDQEVDLNQAESMKYDTLSPQEGLTPLVTLENGALLIFALSDFNEQIWIICDPDLIRNKTFLENDHMLLLYRLMEGFEDSHLFYWKDFNNRPYLGMQIFTRGAMGFLFLHLIFLGIFFAWYKAVRVGKADLLNIQTRRQMREHFLAVGRLYSQAEPWLLLGQIERRFFLARLAKFFPHENGKEKQWKERLAFYSQDWLITRAFEETESLSQLKKTVRTQGIILKDIEMKLRGMKGEH